MWETTTDARAFVGAAGAFLRSRPVEHTVPLTVSERLVRDPVEGALLGWWTDGRGELAGAFLHTPPYAVLVSAPADAAAELGRDLRGAARAVDAVNAEESVAEAFARGFGARHAGVHQRHRLHRLTELVPPDPPPPGAARVATDDDRELLVAWVTAFRDEAADPMSDVAGAVADRLSHRGFLLWDDGAPVSLAANNRAIEGVVRIGPVYTPPEARRRGYAAGVTAAAAATALADGAREVLLFTDMANPTSNALYRRLGFEPLEDRVLLDLGP
jgi:ribosomal protein S18 acetylase RimI-like enzyme